MFRDFFFSLFRFSAKIKQKKQIHFSLNQTIEQTLDEIDYEYHLDATVKQMAFEMRKNKGSDQVSYIFKHVIRLAEASCLKEANLDFESFCDQMNRFDINENNLELIKSVQGIFFFIS